MWTCPACGELVTNPRHVLCGPCQENAGHTAAVRENRGNAIAARKPALKQRVAALGSDVDPDLYRREIWSKLATMKLAQLVEATGYSKG
jgi:hypothetical protein